MYDRPMKALGILALLLAACGTEYSSPTATQAYSFGPYTLQPSE